MQPYIIVLIFFAVCLAYGIYRAIQDVREEAKQEVLQVFYDAMRESISRMTGFSEAFLGMAKSTECANEAIKRFSIILNSSGWNDMTWKETQGYL